MIKRMLPLLLALLLVCGGCGAEKEYTSDFFAMDTYMSIAAYGKNAESAVTEAERSVNELENLISRTRANTDIANLNDADGEIATISEETFQILSDVKELTITGVFDVTIAAVSDLWGVNTEESHIPLQEEIDAALATVSMENLVLLGDDQAMLLNGAKIDLGGVGKGIAADRCAEILRARGIEDAMIVLGGNIYALGENPEGRPWTVGIADPDDSMSYIATLAVTDTSLVTTGDYERYFIEDGVRYHHVFDPKTGYPARSGLRSVTVVNTSSTLADARSTSLFVMGLEDGMRYCEENGLEAVFITEDKEIYLTDGLRDCFTFCGEEAGYVMAS